MFGAPQRSTNVVTVPNDSAVIIVGFKRPVDSVVSFEPADVVEWLFWDGSGYSVHNALVVVCELAGEFPTASSGVISVGGSLTTASFEFNPTGSPMSDGWTADIYQLGGSRFVKWPDAFEHDSYMMFSEFECRVVPVVAGATAASAFTAEIVVDSVATPCLVEEYGGGRRFTIPSSVTSDDNDQGTFNLYREGCLVWSVVITEP